MNTHSLDLERSSLQHASITDASQTGLDLNSDFTIEAWIKLEQLPSVAGSAFGILTKWQGSGLSWGFVINSTNRIAIQWCSGSGGSGFTRVQTDLAAVSALDVGVWFHLAAAVDLSSHDATIYKNTSPIASTNDLGTSTSIFNGTAEVAVGENNNADYFDGLIDEVRVWNDIRSQSEISLNYQKELVGNEANLVAYWKLNNNYLDETSNNNDLTASGSPVFSTNTPFAGLINSESPMFFGGGATIA